jgi:flagellar protein FliO/FliZ
MTGSASYLEAILALLAVLGLLAVLAALLRRWRHAVLGTSGGPRLAIIETMPIDSRTRLVLVRHDSQEHLLVVGGMPASILSSRPAGTDAP